MPINQSVSASAGQKYDRLESGRFAREGGELHRDLKGKTIRGGAITVASQFIQFTLYTVSMMVLARLISPEDYGLVGMVTAATGFLRLFKDAGLSTATVQRDVMTADLASTAFWINMTLGAVITLLAVALAPALVALYREPRLYWITIALAATFSLDAVATQHQALLRREMRFNILAGIDVLSSTIGLGVGIMMALSGYGYWALVSVQISTAAMTALAVWIARPWRPGLPKRGIGAGSMMRFGGFLTGVNLLNYLFRNVDNVMLGWYWGPSPLGFYQKAYSLLMLPISQVNAPISAVAVGTLSRLQSDAERQRRYFVGGYAMAISITLPIIVAVTIFSGEVIQFVLGPKWLAAVPIFRLLAPAALVGALLNPLGWLYISSGRSDRQLKCSVVWSTLIILSFGAGLRFGPKGVAIGYSAMACILALPVCLYGISGTPVRFGDLVSALKCPVLAVIPAGAFGMFIELNFLQAPVSLRAIGGCFAVLSLYAFILLVVMRQWGAYRDLIRHILPARKRSGTQ